MYVFTMSWWGTHGGTLYSDKGTNQMDTLHRNSRAVLYFCPDSETQLINTDDEALHWKIDRVSTLQEAQEYLKLLSI